MKHISRITTFLLFVITLSLCSEKSAAQSAITPNQQGVVLFSDFLSNKTDTVSIDYRLELWRFINILKCLSGYIYFTGDGFSSAIAIQCTENKGKLKLAFEKSTPGSKVVFDNCSFYRDGGKKPIIITKTLVFK